MFLFSFSVSVCFWSSFIVFITVETIETGELLGVYSNPERDPRFHAVTVLVAARIKAPTRPPSNPVEILDAALFDVEQLPSELSHGNKEMVDNALGKMVVWE